MLRYRLAMRFVLFSVVLCGSCTRGAALRAQSGTAGDEEEYVQPHNWDLVSLEQNNARFNASVLSGFHSIRSPGVSPHRAWKTGIGILYTRQEQVAVASNTELFEQQQVIFNPKINYGLYNSVEVGAGLEATWTEGKDITFDQETATVLDDGRQEWDVSAFGLGLKWGALQNRRLRLALSFDTRIALNRGRFGTLPATVYNFELDGDYAVTSRFSLGSNLQFLTSDRSDAQDQVVLDLASHYSFSDRFRGMIFLTAQEDDEADDILLFTGFAGQYVFEQHSFTLALDLQLNDARREVRTQRQLDIELSYTFTF